MAWSLNWTATATIVGPQAILVESSFFTTGRTASKAHGKAVRLEYIVVVAMSGLLCLPAVCKDLLRDGSVQTVIHAAALTHKSQIKLAI